MVVTVSCLFLFVFQVTVIFKNTDLIMLILLLKPLNGFPSSTESQICDSSYKPWRMCLLLWSSHNLLPFLGVGLCLTDSHLLFQIHAFSPRKICSLSLRKVLGLVFHDVFFLVTCTPKRHPTPVQKGPTVKLSAPEFSVMVLCTVLLYSYSILFNVFLPGHDLQENLFTVVTPSTY